MKPFNKKLVVATTAGMAALFLSTAACGYGPPVDETAADKHDEINTSKENTADGSDAEISEEDPNE
ncbi:MAG: hypothetical protein K6A23_12025 [Butyrivibrio sp.]|nr:hypothetical protein [Butyrivibrio sp.]